MKGMDLTRGSIAGKMLHIALPVMGVQFMQMTYSLVDMFWLGRLGADAVAASGTAAMYLWLSNALQLLCRIGTEIGVAQNVGAGNRDEARHYAQNGLMLSAALGLLYGLAMILCRRPLVGFFNIQEAHVVADTELYLMITSTVLLFNYMNGTLAGIFTGSGDARTPFVANAAGLVLNIVLDPLLIFAFNMGIAGAAVATAAAQMVAFIISFAVMLRGKKRPFEKFTLLARPKKAYLRNISRWGIPVCLESMFFTLMSMVTSRLIAGFGSGALAVSKVGSQVESLSWMIGGGFGSALTSFVGQNYGAGKWTRIRSSFRISVGLMLGWGVLVTLLLFGGARFLISIFLPEPETVALGIDYLRIAALCQLPQCLENVAAGAFRGLGKTFPPSIASMISNIFRVVLAYLFTGIGMGLNGIWWALTLAGVLRGAWILAWYLIDMRKHPKKDAPALP